MGRIKIIGEEKCPHVDRKTGKQDCSKQGRYNPKLMLSWNNRRRFDKLNKREYRQFIHNDGTRHNITSTVQEAECSNPNNFKGHPFEEELKVLNEIQITLKKTARYYRRIATASLTWPLKPAEMEYISTQYKSGNVKPLVDTYKRFEKEKRKRIYDRSKRLHEERYWYTQNPVYESINELAQLPLDEKWLHGLSRHLSPEMVATIIGERWRLNKSKLLRLHDEEELLKGLLYRLQVKPKSKLL